MAAALDNNHMTMTLMKTSVITMPITIEMEVILL